MRILILLLPDGPDPATPPALQFERFVEPYYLFVDAGAEVVLASPTGGDPMMRAADGGRRAEGALMDRFQADPQVREALVDTLCFAQVVLDDFDAAYCVGAPEPITDHPASERVSDVIAGLLETGRPVAAVPGWIETRLPVSADGVLIIGEGRAAPAQAARALIGALAV